MLNTVVLIGRLTRDPDLRYTPSGKAVCTIRLAVDRGTTAADGTKETDFIDCVLWERQAEATANYKKKGDLVGVQGSLNIRQYEDREGHKREKAEIICHLVRYLDNRDAERAKQGLGMTGGEGGNVPWDGQ